jgi:hypothetical protein
VREVRQRGSERYASSDPNRRFESTRHDDRQATLLRDPQACRYAAERLHLQHENVSSVGGHDPRSIIPPSDGLVSGDRNVNASTYGCKFGYRAARLLDVLQTARSSIQLGDHSDSGIRIPSTVSVDSHGAAGSERISHRRDPLNVVLGVLFALGDLDLNRSASARLTD